MAASLESSLREILSAHLVKVCGSLPKRSSESQKKKRRKQKQSASLFDKGNKRVHLDDPPEDEVQINSVRVHRPAVPSHIQVERSTTEIKKMCKAYPDVAPKMVCATLIKDHLTRGATSTERLRAMEMANILFSRSAAFRASMCENIRFVLDAVFGAHVPGPDSNALRMKSAEILRDWKNGFGSVYPQLQLALASANVSDLTPITHSQIVDEQAEVRWNDIQLRLEAIDRGFRIFNGAPLSGVGESEAATLTTVNDVLAEIDTGTALLVPFMSSMFAETIESVANDDVASMADRINNHEEETFDHADLINENSSLRDFGASEESRVIRQMQSEELDDDDMEWEDDDDDGHEIMDGQVEEYAGPVTTTVALTLTTSSPRNNNELKDVRDLLLDRRLMCERSLLPTLLSWNDVLEQGMSRIPNERFAQLLVRVKGHIKSIQDAIGQCARLGISSFRTNNKKIGIVRSKGTSLKRKKGI